MLNASLGHEQSTTAPKKLGAEPSTFCPCGSVRKEISKEPRRFRCKEEHVTKDDGTEVYDW